MLQVGQKVRLVAREHDFFKQIYLLQLLADPLDIKFPIDPLASKVEHLFLLGKLKAAKEPPLDHEYDVVCPGEVEASQGPQVLEVFLEGSPILSVPMRPSLIFEIDDFSCFVDHLVFLG